MSSDISQAKAPRRQIPKESPQANISKRKTSGENFQAKHPSESSQAKDRKRKFPNEGLQANFPEQMLLSERSQTKDANQYLKRSS